MSQAEKLMRKMRRDYFDHTAFDGQPKTPNGWIISKGAFRKLYPLFNRMDEKEQREWLEKAKVTFEGVPLIIDMDNEDYNFLIITDEGVLDENLQTFREIRSEV